MKELMKRTFAARNYPQGSEDRARLNLTALHSEYMPSQPYLVREPFLMSDGTPHPRQQYIETCYRTKTQAREALNAS
jgi:hypothetical protein